VKDSLSILSQEQFDRLTQLQRRLVAQQDSIGAPTVKYIEAMPNNYKSLKAQRPTKGSSRRIDDHAGKDGNGAASVAAAAGPG
jgi:hypothetical protein